MYNSSASSYDFSIEFYSEFNELGTLNDGITAVALTDTVVFNGIDDISELVGVKDLVCINLPPADEDGQDLGAEVPQDIISLQWTPSEDHTTGWTGQNGSDGSGEALSLDQLSRAQRYRIFMYVSDDATQPTEMWPGGAEAAKWQVIGDTTDGQHTVVCPRDKYVGFWVGMMDNSTDSGISTTGDTNY